MDRVGAGALLVSLIGDAPAPLATTSHAHWHAAARRRPQWITTSVKHAFTPTDVWPLRVLLMCYARALAAAAARTLECARRHGGHKAEKVARKTRGIVRHGMGACMLMQRPTPWRNPGLEDSHKAAVCVSRTHTKPSCPVSRLPSLARLARLLAFAFLLFSTCRLWRLLPLPSALLCLILLDVQRILWLSFGYCNRDENCKMR